MHHRRFHVLVADEGADALQFAVDLLKRRDHVVAGAATADDARWWLAGWPVDLLVAAGDFDGSGLRLALDARQSQPDLAALITGADPAEPQGAEAARYGFEVLAQRVQSEQFGVAVAAILGGMTRRPRWPRKEVQRSVSMRVGNSVGKLMDVSYGGLKFELADDYVLRSPVELDFPRADVRVSADVVWSARASEGHACIFGASVAGPPSDATAWRAFVDRIT